MFRLYFNTFLRLVRLARIITHMYYYEVLVASQRYHGDKALTYSSENKLEDRQLVSIPLQRQTVMGVILRSVPKPDFSAKPISSAVGHIKLPSCLLELVDWMGGYYPASSGQLMAMLLPASLNTKKREKAEVVDSLKAKPLLLPDLTVEQEATVKAISSGSERMHLLHGETGSGKTRVYIELIAEELAENKSCILLTPEIGLTPQLTAMIEETFPGQTVVVHSDLTPAERRDRWLRIVDSQEPMVVIGPRSALFAPMSNIGLIVLDEFHDGAYKQEQTPYYLATRVAAKLAELHGAKVVLGSATPPIADYFTFIQKDLPIHRMKERAIVNKYGSQVEIINLRDRSKFSKSNWISSDMIEAIRLNLANNQQSLIFLNRRGSARLVLCQSCGWHAACPRCDISLTYHGDHHLVRCHTCGYKATAPNSCPVCSSADLSFKSIGTKSLVADLERQFPKATIQRFDSDNAKAERLEAQFEAVKSGKADIIVGTQLLAKGLDLPKLGLVGIVNADTGLYFPDFTAEERTFQLISQVTGRANRGHRDTRVIVQTYGPDNQTLTQALNKDYGGFYEQQLAQRKAFGFPPFRYLLKLKVERSSPQSAEKAAGNLSNELRKLGLKLEVSAPAPAFTEKVQNRYRWHVIVKAVDRKLLLVIIKQLPSGVGYDIDPANLL
jgi:primosomal protein N' (replication factor Y)